jgi:hypothetical protein
MNYFLIFGLKSASGSLSITPDLSPGLLKDLKNRALARNGCCLSFLLLIFYHNEVDQCVSGIN